LDPLCEFFRRNPYGDNGGWPATVPIVYFDKPGKRNTERTLEIARARAEKLGIGTILVATTTGATGVRAGRVFQGYDVVAVTHFHGFRELDTAEVLPEHRAARTRKERKYGGRGRQGIRGFLFIRG